MPNASTLIQEWSLSTEADSAIDSIAGADLGYKYKVHRLKLATPIVLTSGGLYLGLNNSDFHTGFIYNGYVRDNVLPHTRRTFEITGGIWGPNRNLDSLDYVASLLVPQIICALEVPVLAGRDTSFCPGGSTVLTAPDTGTYVWMLTYTPVDGKPKTLKGTSVLLR